MCLLNNDQLKRPGCLGHRKGLQPNMAIPIFINHFIPFQWNVCVCVFLLWSLSQVAAMKTYGLGLEFISPPMRNNEKARCHELFL